MQRIPAVWSRYVMIGLSEHGIKTVEGQVFGEEPMGEAVDIK